MIGKKLLATLTVNHRTIFTVKNYNDRSMSPAAASAPMTVAFHRVAKCCYQSKMIMHSYFFKVMLIFF